MTCREKLAIEHPEQVTVYADGGCWGCPCDYDYLGKPDYCHGFNAHRNEHDECTYCWDREIPDESKQNLRKEKMTMFNPNSVNEAAYCSAMPENKTDTTSLCDKVKKLHEMISDAEAITKDTRMILFGAMPIQEASPEPSVTCMDEDVDAMLRQMKQVLDHLGEIRNRIG